MTSLHQKLTTPLRGDALAYNCRAGHPLMSREQKRLCQPCTTRLVPPRGLRCNMLRPEGRSEIRTQESAGRFVKSRRGLAMASGGRIKNPTVPLVSVSSYDPGPEFSAALRACIRMSLKRESWPISWITGLFRNSAISKGKDSA